MTPELNTAELELIRRYLVQTKTDKVDKYTDNNTIYVINILCDSIIFLSHCIIKRNRRIGYAGTIMISGSIVHLIMDKYKINIQKITL